MVAVEESPSSPALRVVTVVGEALVATPEQLALKLHRLMVAQEAMEETLPLGMAESVVLAVRRIVSLPTHRTIPSVHPYLLAVRAAKEAAVHQLEEEAATGGTLLLREPRGLQ